MTNGHFTLQICRERKRNVQKFKKKHVKGIESFCLCSLTMQNFWRCRCCRVVDLKLPICVKNPNEWATCEWGLFIQTTSEHKPLTKYCLCRELFLAHKTRIFIETVSWTQVRKKNLLILEPNANIAVQAHQGNKVLNGNMRVQNFFEQRYIFLCFYLSVLIFLMLCKLV